MFPPLLLGLHCRSFGDSRWGRARLGLPAPSHTLSLRLVPCNPGYRHFTDLLSGTINLHNKNFSCVFLFLTGKLYKIYRFFRNISSLSAWKNEIQSVETSAVLLCPLIFQTVHTCSVYSIYMYGIF